MNDMLNSMFSTMLMAPINFPLYQTIRYIMLALIIVSAIFLVIVILMQPGNSSGVSALSGETETFLGRNKSKTREGILKTLTIIAIAVLVVLSIAYFIFMQLFPTIA